MAEIKEKIFPQFTIIEIFTVESLLKSLNIVHNLSFISFMGETEVG